MSMPTVYHSSEWQVNDYSHTAVNPVRGLLTHMDDKSIADRLKRLRNAKKWTQAKLAGEAGVSTGTIGNVESGLREYGASVVDIARALGTTPEYLQMKERKEPPAQPDRTEGLTRDALTVAAIFDWLTEKRDRDVVCYILTQAVLERMAPNHPGAAVDAPQEQPTDTPAPTVPAGKRRV